MYKRQGKRSNEIVAERNKMAVKQVQRYIRLNELVPDLSLIHIYTQGLRR